MTSKTPRTLIAGALLGFGALLMAGATVRAQAQATASPECINKGNPFNCVPYSYSYPPYPYAGYYRYAPPPYYGYPPPAYYPPYPPYNEY